MSTAGPTPGVALAAVGYKPGQREDADADNSADADGRQLPEAKTFEKSAVLVFFLNIVDGLAPQDGLGSRLLVHGGTPASWRGTVMSSQYIMRAESH